MTRFELDQTSEKNSASVSPLQTEFLSTLHTGNGEQKQNPHEVDRITVARALNELDYSYDMAVAKGADRKEAAKSALPGAKNAVELANEHYETVSRAVLRDIAPVMKDVRAYDESLRQASNAVQAKIDEHFPTVQQYTEQEWTELQDKLKHGYKWPNKDNLESDLDAFLRYDSLSQRQKSLETVLNSVPGLHAAADGMKAVATEPAELRGKPAGVEFEKKRMDAWEPVAEVLQSVPRQQRQELQSQVREYIFSQVQSVKQHEELEKRLRHDYPDVMDALDRALKLDGPNHPDMIWDIDNAGTINEDKKTQPFEDKLTDALELQIRTMNTYGRFLKTAGETTTLSEVDKQIETLNRKMHQVLLTPIIKDLPR